MIASLRPQSFSALLLLALLAPAKAQAEPNEAELRAFRDTAERYAARMAEFEGDVRQIVDLTEEEERSRILSSFGAAMARAEDDGNTLRRVTIAKLETFLQRYPNTRYSADMKFRLADLYYDESELDFVARTEEYGKLQDQAESNPSMVLPEPPEKDYRRSIGIYNDILASYPDFEYRPDTYYMLGWCYGSSNAMQQDDEAARDAYLAIVTRYSKSVFANDSNMRLGEYYFELPATREDPVANVRTAIKYYGAVLADGPTGRNYDRAIYKLGWSHYKLNEYDRALAYLVQLLDYSDSLYDRSGRVADTRKEAVEYLAISYADMADRQGKKPVDIAKAHFAKVGDKRWEHDVIERLASILTTQAKFEESVETYRFLQSNWPLHPQNPIYQHEISQIYAVKMPVHNDSAAGQALEELGEKYSDKTSWYAANKNNPDAIAQARGFIESSLATVATEKLIRCRETTDAAMCRDAAVTFRDFLQKYPFATDYDQYEWYLAYAWFSAGDFAEAARQYQQVLKNPHSTFKDGARFQLMKSREQIALAKYGKLEDVPQGALVTNTITTPFGKQIVQYMVSDEQTAFRVAADDLADREFSDPEWIPVLDKIRPAMAYYGGVISFTHGYYDDARKRLQSVVNRYPGSKEAGFSAKLILQTYTNEGDIPTLVAKARELNVEDIVTEGTLEICLQTGRGGDHLGSAECYGKFLAEFPKHKYASVALYNQANQLDLGGQTGQANVLFEKYINENPTDERSKSLYFRIASGYSSILELDKAIRYFETLVRVAPENVDSPAALYSAAFLRTGIGDHKGAAQAYEKYANLPNVPDAEIIYWKAGEQWELVGSAQAIEFYERYLRNFPSDRPGFNASHAIIAQSKLSDLYLAKGDKRKAAQKLADLDATFRDNVSKGVNSDARKLAALAPMQALVAELEAFKTFKWTTNEKTNAELVLTKKPEELRKLTDDALQLIQTYQDYDAAAAALYVQGAAYFAYSDIVYAYPLPPGLNEEEQQLFQDLVDEKFSPIRIKAEDTGKARLGAALEKARVDKRWSTWNSKTVELLHDRFPIEFPSERQESRGTLNDSTMETAGPASPKSGGAK
ncbi:hypothetical protein LBMAG42_04410 [Deltaproteobacteria bacterium]|nr:hypothetical protein LBMAG42_04410 [Deltaproteobacteria bacterium]